MHYTQNRKSVLILQTWLNYRGAERISIDLIHALRERGIRSRLLCLFVTDAVIDDIDRSLLLLPPRYVQRLCQNSVFFMLFGFWIMLVMTLVYGRKFDSFNAHNFPSYWVASIVGTIYRKNTVWYVNNFPQHPFRGKWMYVYELLTSRIDRFFVHKLKSLCVSSVRVQTEVFSRYHRHASVVYYVPDLSEIKLRVTPDYVPDNLTLRTVTADSTREFLSHVGHVHPDKNQQFSVDVFCALADSFPHLSLLICGSGDPSFLSLPSQYASRIIFTGRLSRADTAYVYSRSRYILHPSYMTEGCSLTPMEAVWFGPYTLVARGCGADELFLASKCPFVFDPMLGIDAVLTYIRETYYLTSRPDYSNFIHTYTHTMYVDQMLDYI